MAYNNGAVATVRLGLKIISETDNSFMYKLVNSPGWLQFIGDRNVRSVEDASTYINKILNMENLSYWVVRIKEDNTPIGIVSFLKRNYLEHFDIGFAFLPAYNGNGYAYEATKAILDIVMLEPKHEKILATTIPSNISSIKLLNKLGLHFERELDVDKQILHIYST
jgi:[ribosomal protein S5]-alanine N-acetyltransferase